MYDTKILAWEELESLRSEIEEKELEIQILKDNINKRYKEITDLDRDWETRN